MKELARRAADTTEDNPWPLRVLSEKIKAWADTMTPVWVEGQLTQVNRRPGAHLAFLVIRDADAEFSMTLTLPAREMDKHPVPLKAGARVVTHARPTFWAKRGTLQLEASEIKPLGEGDLLARVEELKRKLAAEGLFAPERKVPLPFLPAVVGLICGRESKAEHDVVVNARERFPSVRFEIREVAVQGTRAVPEVCEALGELDANEEIEVIVIARGGGSVEDLLPFSSERLVRSAAAARTPLVSAIGHETDTPLLDLVADYRASTPTDAAKRIVPDVREESRAISQRRSRLVSILASHIARERSLLDGVRSRPVFSQPHVLVTRQREQLALACGSLQQALARRLDTGRWDISRLRAQVVALSPKGTLERGYAVVRDENRQVLTRAGATRDGAAIEVLLADGRLEAAVTAVHASTFDPDGKQYEEN